ncbi:hypothetical protein [Streptomyces olivochromogenes]|uniref:hypothetical protein n=1 Tax=Streptomyces olivochromogenes TaxID=1963 RepID=UPI001F2F30B4|nr:hypothetical protein [Streptomyces olivochromogenes]MCF3130125.1 hypothetical protein [Streptomyces olivochromogenes]
MDTWKMCIALSRRIVTAADQIPEELTLRHRRFKNWSMNPKSADALLETLLALSIHSLVVDAAAHGNPDAAAVIQQTPLADIARAATVRPHHELLAGLPPLTEPDQLRVNALKVLIYDDASALPLGRLSQTARITMQQLAAAIGGEDPVCSDIPTDPQ